MSITEISEAMGMPQSSTSALVRSLVALSYLEHDPQRRKYYPTLRIAMLGTWMRRRHTKMSKIPKLLSDVAEATGETAVIAIRNGIYARYILGQDGSDRLKLRVESANACPLVCCAVGWALLTSEPDREIGKIVRRTQLEAPKKYWRETAATALDDVRLARRRGFAQSNGQTLKGASAIAILLPVIDGRSMAVGVGGPTARVAGKKDIILEALHKFSELVTAKEAEDLITIDKLDREALGSID